FRRRVITQSFSDFETRSGTLSPCGRGWRAPSIARRAPGEGLFVTSEELYPSPGPHLRLGPPSPARGEGFGVCGPFRYRSNRASAIDLQHHAGDEARLVGR